MRLPARTGRTISGDPTHGNRAVATGRDCNRQALAGLLAERFPEMRQILRPGRFGTPVATLLRLADPARATLQAPA